jgi:protein-disulfide isomerase
MDRTTRTILAGALVCALLTPLAAGAQEAGTAQSRFLDKASAARAKGSATATVMVYEIADFQCPFCARFAVDVFPHIDSAYVKTGKVQWVFVNLPAPAHTNAWIASEAAMCAGAVSDRFWVMHDRLYVAGREWTASADPGALMTRYAKEAGLPMDAWNACVADDRLAPLILQDVIFGSRVTGTPTFIINNEQTIVGVKSFEEWRQILDAALKKK